MSDNFYASPTAEPCIAPDTARAPKELRVASQNKRFANLIIDYIVTWVLSAAAGVVIGVIFAASRIAANRAVTMEDEAVWELAGFAVGLMIHVGYFVIMEALFQRTLAKLLTGTLVVTETGERPSWGQIVGRSFARLIPFEPVSFLASNHPVGWHDSLSGTRVISTR